MMNKTAVTFRRLFSFFIPLGFSASLVTLSHVIINSTLARSSNPELTIASYSVAMSVFIITERPAIMLRQTCSLLVKSRSGFKSTGRVAALMLCGILLFALIIAYTPIGMWFLLSVFHVKNVFLASTLHTYRVLMFVTIFSALRVLFQGLIISHIRTKWLTIGMSIRLVFMYLISVFLIHFSLISGPTGALIFLSGMIVEAVVSIVVGRSIYRFMPEIAESETAKPLTTRRIFSFYRPLVYSSLIAVIVPPAINAFLGKTSHMELAIASYAVAWSVAQLMTSFFSYVHQIVLHFFANHARKVVYFTALLSLAPTLLVSVLSFSPIGVWFLQNIMGVKDQLLISSVHALRIFIIYTLVFPWLDFGNGMLMLRGETRYMVWTQSSNVAVTLTVLILCILTVPEWNGMIGALAQSLGFLSELSMVVLTIKRTKVLNNFALET